ncbi:MAG: DNA/RNA non-specific endonuclease [Saprospiraceae bacterium]
MANFRKNHLQKSNPFIGLTFRVFVIFIILVILFKGVSKYYNNQNIETPKFESQFRQADIERDYLPKSSVKLDVIHHQYYSLGYDEKHEISHWVAYILTKNDLKARNVKRYRDYIQDPLVHTKSAHYKDYSKSGYTRGHLAPAGDMAFNKAAMKESFYMSNITPQLRQFNNGIWKELEENVRDWAYFDDKLYIVSGPIVNSIENAIGRQNKVGVPEYFYKAVLAYQGSKRKAIGFIIPNERSDEPLANYAVNIDEIEKRTNLDLFADIYTENEGAQIESTFKLSSWKISKKRFNLRVNKWNKE